MSGFTGKKTTSFLLFAFPFNFYDMLCFGLKHEENPASQRLSGGEFLVAFQIVVDILSIIN